MSSTTSISNSRHIPVTGAYNVRDLGGYETKTGQTTRWGVFYRADGLHQLSEDSTQALIDRNIHTVIDLRSSFEVDKQKDVFDGMDGVHYINIALINPAKPKDIKITSLYDMYVELVDYSQELILQVFKQFLEVKDGAILFHCTAGKDRTGVIAALLLELLGVPEKTIVEDYALTASCIAPILPAMREARPSFVPEEMYERFLGCEPEYMEQLLHYMHEKYGSSEAYLRHIGLSEDELAELKSKFTAE
ncbi:tyrosine-protein phosphatase [Paenibacillus sp. N1-5-1-14]|uniref:tyrosine-protein phosphatase n=1 Tax=Paenibacillus radicibacter TaxID=2972488 RepID=UPI002159023D|nr:tyrosine-protein phosphatase [Paenibacillus radicibacter]MCR8642726.1 tyrosine-protein phosphatase [Paenibacillus radicibacter]